VRGVDEIVIDSRKKVPESDHGRIDRRILEIGHRNPSKH
jgi:hypothetical protein